MKLPAIIFRRVCLSITIIVALTQPLYSMTGDHSILEWQKNPSPVYDDWSNITFITPDSGFVIGKQILFYANGYWTEYPWQPPIPVYLASFIDTRSVFVASITPYQESELFLLNGKQWDKIWHPLANTILSMDFTDCNNGVIAGYGEVALLQNGQWHYLPPPSNASIESVVIQSDSVIWVQVFKQGLFKYNGTWTKIKSSEKVHCFKCKSDTVYAIGNNFLGMVNGNDSLVILSTYPELKQLTSFSVISADEIMAVGRDGLIMHYKNTQWEKLKSGVQENLNDIRMINEYDGWIAGDHGVILHYTANKNGPPARYNWNGFKTSTILNSDAKIIDDEYGVVACDFNKDGWTDIFTCGLFEANHLYINSGNAHLTDEAQQWNVSGNKSVNFRELNLGACSGDFDNDGYPDLYVAALNGNNKIYRNIRGKYFTNYSSISGGTGQPTDRTNAVITGDVDNDGDLDLFLANENGTNRLFLNNGAGIFSEITEPAGLTTEFGGTGCSFGDIDGDGDLDLYVANWSSKNLLYRNLLMESEQLVFENITNEARVGGEIYTKSNAVVFSDVDNDADLDLFVTNRKTSNKLYMNDGHGYFSDMTSQLLGTDSLKSYGAIIHDFDGDGFKDIYVSNVGPNVFYQNQNGNYFVDKTRRYGAEIDGYSTGSAAADYDNNGTVDMYIANYIGETSSMLLNTLHSQQFIKVYVSGIKSNQSGIGTKIFIYGEDAVNQRKELVYYTEISGGSGYASMNQRFLPIPIPGREYVNVKVVFPGGKTIDVNHVKAGSTITVEDVNGIPKLLALAGRYIILFVKDPHRLVKLLAWIIVVLVTLFAVIHGSKRYAWPLYLSLAFMMLMLFVFFVQSDYFAYRNMLLSTILPIFSVIILLTLIYLYYERNRIRKLADAEQEKIQKKLSRDLHDDLGSTVSTIGIYLTLIRYNLKNSEKIVQLLDKSSELVNSTASAITDMVWAVNPKPESLDNLIMRVTRNFTPLFHEQGGQLGMRTTMDMEQTLLNYKVKQNIYLIMKEALNNTLKYADAMKTEIVIDNSRQGILIRIKDNGNGFNLADMKNKGHGLTNMRIRAEEIGAQFDIQSTPWKGTEINILFNPG